MVDVFLLFHAFPEVGIGVDGVLPDRSHIGLPRELQYAPSAWSYMSRDMERSGSWWCVDVGCDSDMCVFEALGSYGGPGSDGVSGRDGGRGLDAFLMEDVDGWEDRVEGSCAASGEQCPLRDREFEFYGSL